MQVVFTFLGGEMGRPRRKALTAGGVVYLRCQKEQGASPSDTAQQGGHLEKSPAACPQAIRRTEGKYQFLESIGMRPIGTSLTGLMETRLAMGRRVGTLTI